jgi:hypothetical protein
MLILTKVSFVSYTYKIKRNVPESGAGGGGVTLTKHIILLGLIQVKFVFGNPLVKSRRRKCFARITKGF